MTNTSRLGPLDGLRVVEFVGIGPGPHCTQMLADLGAEVLSIQKSGGNGWPNPVIDRARNVVTADIRTSDGRALCVEIIEKVDILIEGYRPGVMERLGLGPIDLLSINPRLIYGRMTGWGQEGPLAHVAGHDINYVALSGALSTFGWPDTPPTPPLNLVGDFGGGSTFLAFGIMAAVYERQRSGLGQIVDAAIIDGMASLMGMFAGMPNAGADMRNRKTSMLGGAAPFYRCYECSDGEYVSVGAIEPKFYAELMARIGAPQELLDRQHDASLWQTRSLQLEKIFRSKSREEWTRLLEGTDCCFAPVLSLEEALVHAHTIRRNSYEWRDGAPHHKPAPRFSRTPGAINNSEDGADLLVRWGVHRNAHR